MNESEELKEIQAKLDGPLEDFWDIAYSRCDPYSLETRLAPDEEQDARARIYAAVRELLAGERERLAQITENRTDGWFSMTPEEIRAGSIEID